MAQLYVEHGPSASGQKVMLATTVYDKPDASYVSSIASTREALTEAGIQSAYLIYAGNCHVDDARNRVVREFLASDCTELFFLDADVSWLPKDLVSICKHDCALVGAVYPYRDPSRRDDMPVRMLSSDLSANADGLIEVDGLPTGFMRIHRNVFDAIPTESKPIPGGDDGQMNIYFERMKCDGHWRSGDLAFCWKWRQQGGSIWCDPEIRLGHAAKTVVCGSLGQVMRVRKGETLKWTCERIANGTETLQDFAEVSEWVANPFAASYDVLAAVVRLARQGNGHIIETGCGISTVLMAAAVPDHYVYCIEHDPFYAEQMRRWADQACVKNIGIVLAGLGADGWYDRKELDGLPETFAFGFCDGPPRHIGRRLPFLDELASRCGVIAFDDVDNQHGDYFAALSAWAESNGRKLSHSGRLAVAQKPRFKVKATRKAA